MFNKIIDDDSYMKTDIYEMDNKYYIEIDLPGFKKENLQVIFSHGYITVVASKQIEETDKNFIKRERTYGSYKREFYVGNVDYSKINSRYKDGVLTIEVLKNSENKEQKTIEIK